MPYADVPLDESLVRQLLSGDPRRLSHVLGVVRTAHEVIGHLGQNAQFVRNLNTAALFHDIGYAPDLRITGFHPLDGALFLAQHGADPEVVTAVLFHTAASSEALSHVEAASHYRELGTQAPSSLLLDVLTFSDLRTSPSGELITIQERVGDIANRYGSNHHVTRNILSQTSYFAQVSARVLNVVAQYAAHPLPWLFIDIDDTLVPVGSNISEKSRQALETYVTRGGRVSLATGKHPGAIGTLARMLPKGAIHITGNGAVEIRNSGGSSSLLSDFGPYRTCVTSMLEALNVPYAIYALEGIYINSPCVSTEHIRILDSIGEPTPMRGEPDNESSVFKVLSFVDESRKDLEAVLRLKAAKLGVACIRTSRHFIEFMLLGSSKGAAMAAILHEAQWPLFHTVAFGDSENDLSMMRRSGLSVAVGNASLATCDAADLVVEACTDDGVAWYVSKLLD